MAVGSYQDGPFTVPQAWAVSVQLSRPKLAGGFLLDIMLVSIIFCVSLHGGYKGGYNGGTAWGRLQ